MKIKLKPAFAILIALIFLFPAANVNAYNDINIGRRSKLDILNNYNKNNFGPERFGTSVEYMVEPSAQNNFNPGIPKQEYIDEALNLVNFIRFIVGLPDDIVINEQYNIYAQNASMVNFMNGSLSHDPKRPGGMPTESYDLAYKGAQSSNIGLGYPNIKNSIIFGYMEDGDTSNISRLGHRRWILNPPMKEIGFGYVNRYTATYVFDKSRDKEIIYDFISWPNRGYIPIEYFNSNYPWSINLGQEYDLPQSENVEVVLKDIGTGEKWTFNADSNQDPNLSAVEDFFNIDNQGYGMKKCIIFRPKKGSINIEQDSKFEVSVKGIYKSNIESPINFTIEFFPIKDSPSSWAIEEVLQSDNLSLIPDEMQNNYLEDISRLDFCHLVVNLLEVKTGLSPEEFLEKNNKTINRSAFYDTSDIEVLTANALGIVSGKGNRQFDPNSPITRQEAAVMLTNTARVLDMQTTKAFKSSFSDWDNIASWAKDSVDFVHSTRDKSNNTPIMTGVGENKFAPSDTYTRQQAFITIKRLFNSR